MPYAKRGRKVRNWTKRQQARRDRYRRTENETMTRLSTATRKQMEQLLADYYAANETKRDADKEYRRARKAVESVPDGQFGDYLKTYGNPRTIQDNDAVAKRFEELNETVPTKQAFPLVVRKVER